MSGFGPLAGYPLSSPISLSSSGYTIAADYGTYSITGQTASLIKTHILSCSNGTYNITGQNATITYSGASNTITLKAGSWLRYRIIS